MHLSTYIQFVHNLSPFTNITKKIRECNKRNQVFQTIENDVDEIKKKQNQYN